MRLNDVAKVNSCGPNQMTRQEAPTLSSIDRSLSRDRHRV